MLTVSAETIGSRSVADRLPTHTIREMRPLYAADRTETRLRSDVRSVSAGASVGEPHFDQITVGGARLSLD